MVPRTCVPALTSQEKRPRAWLRVEVHLALDRRHDAQLRLLRRRDSPRGRPCTHQHTEETPSQSGENPPGASAVPGRESHVCVPSWPKPTGVGGPWQGVECSIVLGGGLQLHLPPLFLSTDEAHESEQQWLSFQDSQHTCCRRPSSYRRHGEDLAEELARELTRRRFTNQPGRLWFQYRFTHP